MKGGKVESGTAQRKLGGSNPREAAEAKLRRRLGTCEAYRKVDRGLCGLQSARRTGERKRKSRGQRLAEKAQKEKPICSRCLKKQLQMKREKKGTGISLVTS